MSALEKLRRKISADLRSVEFFVAHPDGLPTKSLKHLHQLQGRAATLKQVLARIDGHINSAHDKRHDRRKR